MDSSASDGAVFVLLHLITCLVLSLVSSVYADLSPESYYCFDQSSDTVCLLSVEYPLEAAYWGNFDRCGYPGFAVGCNEESGLRPFINISNHIYHAREVDYGSKVIRLMDVDVEGSGCPEPKRNFSFPSSPSWVKYDFYYPRSVTVFYNCSRVPVDAEKHLLCSKQDTNTPPSYAFYNDETRAGFDWYGNCAQNVVVPVLYNSTNGVNYSTAMKRGFYMGWSATDWCEDCERSGGRCWSIHNSTATGCACENYQSYNRTCPPKTPPPHRGPRRTPLPPRRHQGIHLGLKVMIGVFVGIGGLLFLTVLLVYTRKKFRINQSPIDVKAFLESYGCPALHRYTYLDIKKITYSFKDKLGEGGYGQVFKGKLRDGRMVAVKLLNGSKGDGEDFINEVATIGRTNHVNVVTLMGFCIEGKRQALVYEFMPNGSLERFIYTQKEPTIVSPLGWEKLYEIALGISRGLEYLHRGCNTRILHFDIKPHNILLDKDFCPKISDFGLAKLYPTRESTVSVVGARGTMGYIAPELCYRNFGSVSHKSDVYSYGMMMLEMIGGRKNIDTTVENISEIYFPFWIYNHLIQNTNAEEIKDIQAKEVFENEKAKKMIIVALWCIQALPVERPSMSKVVEMLEGNIHDLRMPPNPSLDLRSSSSTSL